MCRIQSSIASGAQIGCKIESGSDTDEVIRHSHTVKGNRSEVDTEIMNINKRKWGKREDGSEEEDE